MSIRTSLIPSLLRGVKQPLKPSHARLFHFLPSSPPSNIPKNPFSRSAPFVKTQAQHQSTFPRSSIALAVGLGLSLTTYSFTRPSIQCEAPIVSSSTSRSPEIGGGNPPPQSILSVYQLGFGAACGICSGVFVKKGLRALAFVLGGIFILLQYLSSTSYIKVDWSKFSSKYDSVFGTKTANGGSKAPTIGGVYAWIVDFLTANFQQRASFVAGFVLGIRLG